MLAVLSNTIFCLSLWQVHSSSNLLKRHKKLKIGGHIHHNRCYEKHCFNESGSSWLSSPFYLNNNIVSGSGGFENWNTWHCLNPAGTFRADDKKRKADTLPLLIFYLVSMTFVIKIKRSSLKGFWRSFSFLPLLRRLNNIIILSSIVLTHDWPLYVCTVCPRPKEHAACFAWRAGCAVCLHTLRTPSFQHCFVDVCPLVRCHRHHGM